jgi:hypothetical protein
MPENGSVHPSPKLIGGGLRVTLASSGQSAVAVGQTATATVRPDGPLMRPRRSPMFGRPP